MRAIDAEDIKRSIAVSALIEDQKTLEQIIDEQPTIEERKGKWIPYLSHGLTVMCSECRSRFDRLWHHCPNCGAKMEGEENG